MKKILLMVWFYLFLIALFLLIGMGIGAKIILLYVAFTVVNLVGLLL